MTALTRKGFPAHWQTRESPTCPKSRDAALRPGRERLARARRSQAEPAAGSMVALALALRVAAGTAISGGAPKGNKNAFKHGLYTAEAIAVAERSQS